MSNYSSVNTFEKCCIKLGEDPNSLPDVYKQSKERGQFVINAYFAKIIVDAINKVDEENGLTQRPCYYPWFYKSGGDFSFDGVYVDAWDDGGDRRSAAGLWFKSRNGAKFGAETFIEFFKGIYQ